MTIQKDGKFDVNIAIGSRWRSAVDTTEVVVVRAPKEGTTIECGGLEMVPTGAEGGTSGSVHPDYADGTQLGKRYVDEEAGLELLCTKAGEGSLAVDGRTLQLKEAKPLPASD